MKENINTNLDDYSNKELENLLELPENYSKEQVIYQINFLNETYFHNNENIKEFFQNIQNRLLDDYHENHNENIIFDDFSNIIETMENISSNTSNTKTLANYMDTIYGIFSTSQFTGFNAINNTKASAELGYQTRI